MKIKDQIKNDDHTINDFHSGMYVEYIKNCIIRTGEISRIQKKKGIIHIKRLYHNPDKVKINNIIKIISEETI